MHKLLVYGIVIVGLILAVTLIYMREGFQYNKLDVTYDGNRMLQLPPNPPTKNWFEPTSYNRPPESYSPSQSGMTISPATVRYNGKSGLSDSYGVGYTDERGWYHST